VARFVTHILSPTTPPVSHIPYRPTIIPNLISRKNKYLDWRFLSFKIVFESLSWINSKTSNYIYHLYLFTISKSSWSRLPNQVYFSRIGCPQHPRGGKWNIRLFLPAFEFQLQARDVRPLCKHPNSSSSFSGLPICLAHLPPNNSTPVLGSWVCHRRQQQNLWIITENLWIIPRFHETCGSTGDNDRF